MSDETKYTERDVVRRERTAFEAGANWAALRLAGAIPGPRSCMTVQEAAADRYPLQRMMRPRVVTDRNGTEWCFGLGPEDRFSAMRGTTLLMARVQGVWVNDASPRYPNITADIAADLAPLFANPTEEDDA
jgi:transposase InsO family protein